MKTFKIKFTRTPIFSFVTNEVSVLDHHFTYFSIYNVELELHDRSRVTAHLC
jgi:hypothetical protein